MGMTKVRLQGGVLIFDSHEKYKCKMISVRWASQPFVWNGKDCNVAIFLDTVNVMNVKLCMIILVLLLLLIELYPIIPLLVILNIFQGHSIINSFFFVCFFINLSWNFTGLLSFSGSRSLFFYFF